MMTRVISRRRGIVVAFLLLGSLLCSGIAADRAEAGAKADRGQMLRLTNQDRAERDRDRLDLDAKLSRYAVRHSRAMANAGYIFHSEDLADVLDDVQWSLGGENVGVGSSLADLEAAFMASKPHRRNILEDDFENAAIGVVKSDGNFWVTVIFYG
jgi:uncharacterized protein YkwD